MTTSEIRGNIQKNISYVPERIFFNNSNLIIKQASCELYNNNIVSQIFNKTKVIFTIIKVNLFYIRLMQVI